MLLDFDWSAFLVRAVVLLVVSVSVGYAVGYVWGRLNG
jgi:uncharacterized membrane protein YraQ (UPF0718 family)